MTSRGDQPRSKICFDQILDEEWGRVSWSYMCGALMDVKSVQTNLKRHLRCGATGQWLEQNG